MLTIGQMLHADAPAFAEAVRRIDDHLREEIGRLETSRTQIAQLAAGDSLALPPEVAAYLGRLREIGAAERIVEAERDAWILVTAGPGPGRSAWRNRPANVEEYRSGHMIITAAPALATGHDDANVHV